MEEKRGNYLTVIIIILILLVVGMFASDDDNKTSKTKKDDSKKFRIISSQENEPLDNIIKDYAKKQGYDVAIEYEGTLDIIQDLNQNSSQYDAIWTSNSIWNYMLDSKVKVLNSKCTSINPVVFAIKKSKAEELGFIGKEIYTKDIVNAISSGKLKFSMPNPTRTNSGASAYLGLLATLAGNPEVLTEERLYDATLKEQLKYLFTGLERSSGSEDFLEELLLKEDYEAVVTYEASIINMNKKLEQQGKEPLYALYPVDGVSISDSPFAYIDNKNEDKKKMFTDIQNYILSDEGQKLLQEKGKRTWYGGISTDADKTVFNPEWGIDTSKYISPVKYPSTNVIKQALNLYQTQLRKPTHVVFCLDYSGSMYGDGIEELRKAMQYILTDEAANDFIQFSEKDKIDIIPFNGEVGEPWSTTNGTQTAELLQKINYNEPEGTTAIYPASIKALQLLQNEDREKYNVSIVLMTDGLNNVGNYRDLQRYYSSVDNKIPIYSIMFGDASSYELEDIAELTNAKVFDGKESLVKAFKEVRGYN